MKTNQSVDLASIFPASPNLSAVGRRISTVSGGALMTALLVAVVSLSLSGQARAQADAPGPTPATLSGGKVISVEEGKKLSDAKQAMFIDTRSPVNFGKGHVPTAVSVAYKEKSDKVASFDASVDQFDMAKLPADKNAKIVFYSDGPTGWKSYKGAVLSIKDGYKNVMYMRGGWADWTAKGLPEGK